MCGIAGIWQLDGQQVETATIRRFIRSLAHRGPDGEAVVIHDQGRLALGHRRLAVLDLTSAGHQPMRSRSGRYEITYNGEVYNFLELRADLTRDGLQFRSEGDTEVILEAFERWGPDCLTRFNGMWSFAIWDHKERTLFLSRDRFGVKPLYFVAATGRFAFASELKAFLHLDGFEPAANIEAVKARLAGNFGEHVLLCGVRSLAPGHCMDVTPTGVRCRRWWSTLDHLVSVPPGLAAQAEEFRGLLFDACRLRLRSDVPIATSLSGGLDSSSVLCSLAAADQQRGVSRQAPEWRRAFIAGFAGTPQDEVRHATLAAERAGAVPVVHQFSGEAFRAHLDEYLYQFEEIGGLAGAGAWALYREMRRNGVVVSLDGHGGDELLGGYDLHVQLALLRSPGFLSAPRRTMDLINTLHHMQGDAEGYSFVNQMGFAALGFPAVRGVARRFRSIQRRYQWLDGMLRRHSFDPDRAPATSRAEEEAIDALGPLTGALYRSFHTHSLPRILRNFDVHAMGSGVEVRMPLLDWRLVCFGFSVPDESKVGGGYTKVLLREAMRGVLPEPVRLRRDKLGYNAPVADWLTSGLRDWLWNELNDPEFLRNELWDGRGLLALARSKRDSHTSWTAEQSHRVTQAVTAHWWLTRGLRPRQSHA